jgi:hypothetical protein
LVFFSMSSYLMRMKKNLAWAGAIVSLATLLVSFPALGQSDDETDVSAKPRLKATGPYGLIVDRNLFHLVPTPPPPPPPPNNAPPPASGPLKLTGFMRVDGGALQAMFANTPANPTNRMYYTLTEGERQEDVELVKINEDDESAIVIYSGRQLTLALKDNKPAAGPGGAPGASARTIATANRGTTTAALPVSVAPPPVNYQTSVVGAYSSPSSGRVGVSGGGSTALASEANNQIAQANAVAYTESTAAMIAAHSDTTRPTPPAPPGLETSSSDDSSSGPPTPGSVPQTRIKTK